VKNVYYEATHFVIIFAPCYFLSLVLKYCPQLFVIKHLQSVILLSDERPNFTGPQ